MPIGGETLGEKHRSFNRLVEEKLHQISRQSELDDIDYDVSDIENLLKIDVACHKRNVEYVLKVLKCEDMLYISRAIKHSAWLIQDSQYWTIINPEYLYTKLFPYMLTEARSKLLLHIRLNLKDSVRNEEFFNYLVDVDLNASMKWLPNCSAAFIASRLEQDIYRIPEVIFLRLLYTTIEPLRVYVKNYYWKRPMLEKAMFIISKYGEEYFDILDTIETGQIPTFNAKYTKLVMKNCPHRFINRISRYWDFIDRITFAKYIKKDDLKEFLENNLSTMRLEYLFPKEKVQRILIARDPNKLLEKLLKCDVCNFKAIKEILQSFSENYLTDDYKKFRLHFLNVLIKRFKTHRFDAELWAVLNGIYTRIGVYKQYKSHYRACNKSIITYKVLHNEIVPKDLLLHLRECNNFKSEQKNFNTDEKNKLFDYLYDIKSKPLKADTGDEDLVKNLESVLLLLQAWGKHWQDYQLVEDRIDKVIKPMRETNNIEAMKALYKRKRVWRKILSNEIFSTNLGEDSCINALKHNPKLLHLHTEAIVTLCSKDDESMKRFCRKLRIYWSDSLSRDYKQNFINNSRTKPSKRLFALLTRKQFNDLLQSCLSNDDKFQWGNIEETTLPKYIARYMYLARPKPSIDVVLKYRGAFLQDALSSFKSVLHSMPAQETIDYIKLQEWPEVIQKLCVLQAFAKFNKEDRRCIVESIWRNTKYSSVRADIFKMSYKSLKKFNKNGKDHRDGYSERVEDEWSHLKHLIGSLTDNENIIVYNLLSKFGEMPFIIRTEYCIIGYNFLKDLPTRCNCRKFMNRIASEVEHKGVLPSLPIDFVAELVNDTIIKRFWTEKLDWTVDTLLYLSVITPDEGPKQIDAFEKILSPVLNNAYRMWNLKSHGLFMVRFNFKKIINKIVYSYKEMLEINKPCLLRLLYDNLKNNLPFKENYVLLTNLKIAIEYFEVLSKHEKAAPKRLYEKTFTDLSEICIKVFCEDVKSYSPSVWKLFFHALHKVLSGFAIPKSTQYKMNNKMLDLSKDLSPDLDVLVNFVVLEQIFFTEYGNEDKRGRQALRERISAHPSIEVKAQCSKLITVDRCSIPYCSYFYNLF